MSWQSLTEQDRRPVRGGFRNLRRPWRSGAHSRPRTGGKQRSKLDVARSLIAAGGLRRMTGDMSGALSSYTEARSLAEEAQKRGGVALQTGSTHTRHRVQSNRLFADLQG